MMHAYQVHNSLSVHVSYLNYLQCCEFDFQQHVRPVPPVSLMQKCIQQSHTLNSKRQCHKYGTLISVNNSMCLYSVPNQAPGEGQ